MGQAKLTYQELLTSVAEVEFIVNSRPLTYVTTGPGGATYSLSSHVWKTTNESTGSLLLYRARGF